MSLPLLAAGCGKHTAFAGIDACAAATGLHLLLLLPFLHTATTLAIAGAVSIKLEPTAEETTAAHPSSSLMTMETGQGVFQGILLPAGIAAVVPSWLHLQPEQLLVCNQPLALYSSSWMLVQLAHVAAVCWPLLVLHP